jgi:hypothetical protein
MIGFMEKNDDDDDNDSDRMKNAKIRKALPITISFHILVTFPS